MEGDALRFLNSFRNIGQDSQTAIEGLLDQEIPRAVTRIAAKGNRQREPTGDLLTDSGDLITYVLELLDEVATAISEGKPMQGYLEEQLDDDDAIETHYSHYLNKRRSALIDICNKIKDTSRNINRIWEQTLSETSSTLPPNSRNTYTPSSLERRGRRSIPSSSYTQKSPLESPPDALGEPRRAFSQLIPYPQDLALDIRYNDRRFTRGFSDILGSGDHDYEEEDDYDEEEEGIPGHSGPLEEMDTDRSGIAYQRRRGPASISTSLSSPGSIYPAPDLDRRGTGNHICPYARQNDCRKGGVDSNDKLVVFKRNSDFRRHMQKHDRPFKCNHIGCQNPGFAR